MGSVLVFVVAAVLVAAAGAWVALAFVRAKPGPAPRAALPLGLIALGALATLGLYMAVGRPDLPGRPHAERLEEVRAKPPEEMSAEELLTVLAEQTRKDPADPRPHVFTGQILLDSGRAADAAQAFQAALRRDEANVAAMMGLGRALAAAEEGAGLQDARALFAAAAAAAPDDPRPPLHLALVLGADLQAAQAWGEFERRMLAAAEGPAGEAALAEIGALLRSGLPAPAAAGLRPTFTRLAAQSPGEPRWALYGALLASQAGDHAGAIRAWDQVAKGLPADDPRQAMAANMRARAAEALEQAAP